MHLLTVEETFASAEHSYTHYTFRGTHDEERKKEHNESMFHRRFSLVQDRFIELWKRQRDGCVRSVSRRIFIYGQKY